MGGFFGHLSDSQEHLPGSINNEIKNRDFYIIRFDHSLKDKT